LPAKRVSIREAQRPTNQCMHKPLNITVQSLFRDNTVQGPAYALTQSLRSELEKQFAAQIIHKLKHDIKETDPDEEPKFYSSLRDLSNIVAVFKELYENVDFGLAYTGNPFIKLLNSSAAVQSGAYYPVPVKLSTND